ncbi:hypothetical protein [Vibrio metschnikovii]|uniref:Transposase n=1 Tax=Vibrio metschnikovii TaxID=28172 RepID=A0A9X0RER4_VIBME|nr:hypothetical protein [Vibrio metschnikovii]MBC5853200.1 hypothetical protein [Vibrio metschnikovii]
MALSQYLIYFNSGLPLKHHLSKVLDDGCNRATTWKKYGEPYNFNRWSSFDSSPEFSTSYLQQATCFQDETRTVTYIYYVENYATMCLHLTQVKKHFTFLKEVYSTVLHHSKSMVGVDLGVKRLATLSNGFLQIQAAVEKRHGFKG